MALDFIDLPDDVLLEINALVSIPRWQGHALTVSRLDTVISRNRLLGRRSGRHALIPLSMTCSRLRRLCIPAIFCVLSLREDTQRELEPPAVLVHVRLIEVHHFLADEVLAPILRATTRVQEVYYHRLAKFHPKLLHLGSLNRLTINDDCIPRNFSLRERFNLPLHVFYMMSSPPWKLRDLSDNPSDETAFVQYMLALAHKSLEVAVLPERSIRLSQLAGISWPRLQELAIHGAQPPADFPLVCLLCMLPLLRVLTLSIAPRRGDPPSLVWPPGTVLPHPLDLHRLERLTMSFPQAHDLIFQPGSLAPLEELSLRDTPRFYLRVEGTGPFPGLVDDIGYTCPGAVLTCAGALRIFQLLSTPPNSCASLLRLELVVRSEIGHFEAELYAQIAAACPRLRLFELHRYRDATLPKWFSDERAIPVAELIEALRACTALRALRLYLDFPLPRRFDNRNIHDSRTERNARRVAAALPWLASVAFLEMDPGNVFYWRMWTRDRTAHGAAQGDASASDLREYETWRELGNFMDPYWV